MLTFVDPRIEIGPTVAKPLPRIANHVDELAELHLVCRDGRLYDVERWIANGRPLQVAHEVANGRATSALQIALETGNHALVLLLLANGYDPNNSACSPLDLALRARRFDLVALLLNWGADPRRVDLDDLFGTYNSDLFERFREMGVDFAARHALADVIAHHTSNKPLLGFAKRHRLSDPKFQTELDIALAHHAAEGNEKGVQLCLWAGANPHTPVPSLRYGGATETGDDADYDDQLLSSAIYEACQAGRADILKRLGPDPDSDDFEELWRAAGSAAVMDILAKYCLPKDASAVIQHHLWWATFSEAWHRRDNLRHLFEIGVRWEQTNAEEISRFRRSLLKASDYSFVELVRMLALGDNCSPEVLRELARTPSMLARMKKVGFIESRDERERWNHVRPTHSREVLKRLGIQSAFPTRPVPRSVRIGQLTANKIEVNREELFERVWSKPVATVAKECGISGPGLKKVCKRLMIPVPPRGYWARLSAGKHVRRPRLPVLTGENRRHS
jgi:ankyrin repeat protein